MIAHRPCNYVAGVPIYIEMVNDQSESFDDWWWRDLGPCTDHELNNAIADQIEEDNIKGAEAGYIMLAAIDVYDSWWSGVSGNE